MSVITYATTFESPIGELLLRSNGDALTALYLQTERSRAQVRKDWRRDATVFHTVNLQLAAYFAGELRDFDLPLAPAGTPFQRKVWDALCEIPYGTTLSYGELARRIGFPGAARAVGLANGSNPIPIIVPCHRVIGANGSLTGYGGGLPIKRWLLAHELPGAGRAAKAGESLRLL